MKCILLFLLMMIIRFVKPEVINIEIASIGNIYPDNMACLPYAGIAQDAALDTINREYRGIFNFTIKYLYDINYRTCADLADNAVFLLTRWFHRERDRESIPVLISPGIFLYSATE
jgi:hypothetical protein